MKVTFIGVGSAFSRLNPNSNILIEHGTIKLLIDCGRLCPAALDKYGLSFKDITHIFLTHLHSDHIGGMEEVAFMTRLVYKRKVTLLSTDSLLRRLWKNSLSGGLEFIEETPRNLAPQRLDNFFTVQPVPAREWWTLEDAPDLRFYLHPTNHVKGMESYGVEVEELPDGQEKRFLFSGDTKFTPDFITNAAQTCSLIFHDCQLFNSGENNTLGVHTSYDQLLQLPPDVRRKIWLYHYGDTRPLPDAQHDGFAGFVNTLQSLTF